MDKVSVIIPTRNRQASLCQTLVALSKQKAVIHEVIVVDSSDTPIDPSELQSRLEFNAFLLIPARPSVCAQRNEGIRRATGDYVLVLDDDMSVDANYIELCLDYFNQHPAALIVSGLVLDRGRSGDWDYRWPPISFLRLVWIFVFQLSIWSDPMETRSGALGGFLLRRIRQYYKNRGNGVSNAGWPVLTDFSRPCFRTRVYFLSAAMIKREWLLANLYTDKLDQHGIGENYGISINLEPAQGVFVLADARAYHHKSPANRLAEAEAYYRRVLALDYFSTRQRSASRKWLVWSLFGNLLTACAHLQGGWALRNCKLIGILLAGRNPLLK